VVKMNKEILTATDIETLKSTSKRLKPGETIIASLNTTTIKTNTGMPQIVKDLAIEKNKESKVLDFPSAEIRGEGIKGCAAIDAFKKAKDSSSKSKPFSLKRTFFQLMNQIESRINESKLNQKLAMYHYDEFGRVYFIGDNKRFYINQAKTHCISEDGLFADLSFDAEGYPLLAYYDSEDAMYDPNLLNFNYMYISKEAAKEGRNLINAEEEAKAAEFRATLEESRFPKEISAPDKIIDFEAYRRSTEEEGPKR